MSLPSGDEIYSATDDLVAGKCSTRRLKVSNVQQQKL